MLKTKTPADRRWAGREKEKEKGVKLGYNPSRNVSDFPAKFGAMKRGGGANCVTMWVESVNRRETGEEGGARARPG